MFRKDEPGCRQSLVTPIDWKLVRLQAASVSWIESRKSLVAPIDWKHITAAVGAYCCLHQSPILGDAY